MKKCILIGALFFIVPFSGAQTSCLGVSCDPLQGLALQMPDGTTGWVEYGAWSGMNHSLRMPEEHNRKHCFDHCWKHAREDQKACADKIVSDSGDGICLDTFKSSLNSCIPVCHNRPHSPSIGGGS